MPEDDRSDDPLLNRHRLAEAGPGRGGTLLHSILTEGPPAGPVYRSGPEGPDSDRPDSPSDLENGIDFGYSQKFFHIADGNLYSVFSPLQGRSYGGKPSFLRKQQCVVRESRGRGRKNPKRGLKFHNFLPSESITSEKDDKSLSGEGEIWKVHAECRLREEHGTKQIMVSNWSVSEGDGTDPRPPDDDEDSLSSVRKAVRDVRLDPGYRRNSKGAEIGAIVHRLGLQPESVRSEPDGSTSNDHLQGSRTEPLRPKKPVVRGNCRKRRKPLQTRKVVPYHQYLSMLRQYAASPLDLSCRSPSPSAAFSAKVESIRSESLVPPSKLCSNPFPVRNPTADKVKKNVDLPLSLSVHLRSAAQPLLPHAPSEFSQSGVIRTEIPSGDRWEAGGTESGDTEERRRAPRVKARSNQRTIIRKKLEDTFRQNGFLVKTKQVSDGEATFCKFRQLKKYTRYYLKSWQDHLPEEVHKLWKGFLPPKTAIPSGGGGKREERKLVAK